MRGPSMIENIGALLRGVALGPSAALFDSGTASPGATATGNVLDRFNTTTFPKFGYSGRVVFPFTLVLASGRSFGLVFALKSSTASGGTYTAVNSVTYSKSKIGVTTTFNGMDCLEMNVNLKPAGRYLKANWNKTFNTTVTGVLVTLGAPVLILGGTLEAPASGATNSAL